MQSIMLTPGWPAICQGSDAVGVNIVMLARANVRSRRILWRTLVRRRSLRAAPSPNETC